MPKPCLDLEMAAKLDGFIRPFRVYQYCPWARKHHINHIKSYVRSLLTRLAVQSVESLGAGTCEVVDVVVASSTILARSLEFTLVQLWQKQNNAREYRNLAIKSLPHGRGHAKQESLWVHVRFSVVWQPVPNYAVTLACMHSFLVTETARCRFFCPHTSDFPDFICHKCTWHTLNYSNIPKHLLSLYTQSLQCPTASQSLYTHYIMHNMNGVVVHTLAHDTIFGLVSEGLSVFKCLPQATDI